MLLVLLLELIFQLLYTWPRSHTQAHTNHNFRNYLFVSDVVQYGNLVIVLTAEVHTRKLNCAPSYCSVVLSKNAKVLY